MSGVCHIEWNVIVTEINLFSLSMESGGALVESMTLNRRVVGSIPALAST